MLLSCLKMILLGGLKIGSCAAFEPFKLKNSSNFTKMHAFWGMNAYFPTGKQKKYIIFEVGFLELDPLFVINSLSKEIWFQFYPPSPF